MIVVALVLGKSHASLAFEGHPQSPRILLPQLRQQVCIHIALLRVAVF